MLSTLPSPVLSGWSWDWSGKKNRSLYAFFPTSEKVETDRGWTQKGVEISVHHHGSSKAFSATAYDITKGVDGAFNTSSYSLMDGVNLGSERVARYSDKALEAFFEAVVAEFPEKVAGSAKMLGWFGLNAEQE